MIFVCVFMFMMFVRNGVRNSIPNPRVNERAERAKRPRSKKRVRTTIRESCFKIARRKRVRRVGQKEGQGSIDKRIVLRIEKLRKKRYGEECVRDRGKKETWKIR